MLPWSLCKGCLTVLIHHGNLLWLCSAGFWHQREFCVSLWFLAGASCRLPVLLCTTWLRVLSQPRATHTQIWVPKWGFPIRRLLSGLPSAVNGDKERGFQGVIQRLRKCLAIGSLVSSFFHYYPSPLLLLIPSTFIIMESIGKGKEFLYGFWQLLSYCSVSS